MAATTGNQKLKDWVDHWAEILQPDAVEWCDGSDEEWDRLTALLVDGGTFTPLDPAKRPNSFLAAVRPRRRRPGRGPHLHQLRARDRRRAHQQLAGARRDEGRAARALPRRDARPHDVRGAVLDGPARLAHRPHRRAALRLRLRGREHADHDPHGPGASSTCSATTASSSRASTRWATRSCSPTAPPGPTCRGRATPRTSTSPTSPRPARSGATARATAATPCSARSASRCASRRRWRATTAGWPSTCSCSASPARRARRPTSPPRSRRPAARRTWR